jgi:hypothetical protein
MEIVHDIALASPTLRPPSALPSTGEYAAAREQEPEVDEEDLDANHNDAPLGSAPSARLSGTRCRPIWHAVY